MNVVWMEEKHAIGIPDIDRQHRELFLITNLLFAQDESQAGETDRQKSLMGLLKRLYAFARYHFSTEENMFRQYGYSRTIEHKKLHEGFTDKVREWLEQVRSDPRFNPVVMEDYLVQWIVFHVQGEDSKYAWEFAQKGHTPVVDFVTPPSGTDALGLFERQQLSLEIKGIDGQHKELVGILQQANDLLKCSPARQKAFLPDLIRRLFYYSQYHFSYEEELMSRHGWKGLGAHRDLHADYIRTIRGLAAEFSERGAATCGHVVDFLKEWIVRHILEEDRKFKVWLGEEHIAH